MVQNTCMIVSMIGDSLVTPPPHWNYFAADSFVGGYWIYFLGHLSLHLETVFMHGSSSGRQRIRRFYCEQGWKTQSKIDRRSKPCKWQRADFSVTYPTWGAMSRFKSPVSMWLFLLIIWWRLEPKPPWSKESNSSCYGPFVWPPEVENKMVG